MSNVEFVPFDQLATSQEAFTGFQSQVIQHVGQADVMIHPWFRGYSPHEKNHQYDERLYVHLQDVFATNRPCIIFEEWENVTNFSSRLLDFSGRVYTVVTQTARPEPVTGEPGWKMVFQVLHRAGVTQLGVGGMLHYLYTRDDAWAAGYLNRRTAESLLEIGSVDREKHPLTALWLTQDLVLQGCVGRAAHRFIRAGFDLVFHDATSPAVGGNPIPVNPEYESLD